MNHINWYFRGHIEQHYKLDAQSQVMLFLFVLCCLCYLLHRWIAIVECMTRLHYKSYLTRSGYLTKWGYTKNIKICGFLRECSFITSSIFVIIGQGWKRLSVLYCNTTPEHGIVLQYYWWQMSNTRGIPEFVKHICCLWEHFRWGGCWVTDFWMNV